MNIAILHYHLLPGGVGRIIQSQVKALSEFYHLKILTGLAPDKSDWKNCDIEILPELNYLNQDLDSEDHKRILQKILTFLKAKLSKNDILHVHNPNLGKNPLATLALSRLAEEDYPLFMHIHDFAEDRPANREFLNSVISQFYPAVEKILYPTARKLAYGVLNSFDRQRISNILDNQKCYFLPNPVSMAETGSEKSSLDEKAEIMKKLRLKPALPVFIYPVRVIQRKNIGEYILFAKLWQHEANWLVTLPPENPQEKTIYQKWKDFTTTQNIPITFEAGTKCSFTRLMAASDKIFTTSLREGFGMAFLEPWVFDKAVAGRDIDYVTRDFREEGIELPYLYHSLQVEHNKKTYDFPELSLEDQMDFISEIDGKHPDTRIKNFQNIKALVFSQAGKNLIFNNRKIIQERYSVNAYGKRLRDIYEKLAGQA
ncbi:MAG: hypothetical protein JXR70_09495 [Spirochaetales bacterium]|nr:hypothetical protein [Spirochaetales bacterium]